MTWAGEVLEGIRKLVHIEKGMESLTDQVKQVALTSHNLDRRVVRMEAEFELLERTATATSRHALPEKSES